MKTILKLAALACVVSLGACSRGGTNEQRADNIEAATDNIGDSIDSIASNTSNGVVSDTLENRADQVRSDGQNAAGAVRDAGTAVNNIESNTVGM